MEKIYIVKEKCQDYIKKNNDDYKIPEFAALLICGMAIYIINKLVDELPDLIKEMQEYEKRRKIA